MAISALMILASEWKKDMERAGAVKVARERRALEELQQKQIAGKKAVAELDAHVKEVAEEKAAAERCATATVLEEKQSAEENVAGEKQKDNEYEATNIEDFKLPAHDGSMDELESEWIVVDVKV